MRKRRTVAPQSTHNRRPRALTIFPIHDSGQSQRPLSDRYIQSFDLGMAMNWHVVSVNSRSELEITERINSAGLIAVCPTWIKKYSVVRRGRHYASTKIEVLYPRYLFVAQNIQFVPSKFESAKTRLTVFRKGLLTDEAMNVIQSVALDLTMAQTKMTHGLVIKRGDVMQILHHALQGEPVDILEARKNKILVRLKVRPEWKEFWVDRASLGKAM